jgi:hypothetical protein
LEVLYPLPQSTFAKLAWDYCMFITTITIDAR